MTPQAQTLAGKPVLSNMYSSCMYEILEFCNEKITLYNIKMTLYNIRYTEHLLSLTVTLVSCHTFSIFSSELRFFSPFFAGIRCNFICGLSDVIIKTFIHSFIHSFIERQWTLYGCMSSIATPTVIGRLLYELSIGTKIGDLE